MVPFIIFILLLIVSFVLVILSLCLDWHEEFITIFTCFCIIFSIFAGISGYDFRFRKEQKKCEHSFITCDHKANVHNEFSVCVAKCVNCKKKIGVLTPEEIYEYNLSHR